MTPVEIIDAILSNENITAAKLSSDIGLSRPQSIYDIQSGKVKNISLRIVNLIHNAKPIYRKEWLMTGEGEMLDSSIEASTIIRKNEPVDSISVISRLVEINAKKDEELRELRKAYEILAAAFERLANEDHAISGKEKKA